MSTPNWKLRGKVILACNCDYGCPCNFNGLPTTGNCEGNWNWYIEDGAFGDVRLDGLSVSLAVNWPGAIHEGDGHGMVIIDEAADERQREALVKLIQGEAGGPWQIIATTISKREGPHFAKYEFDFDGFTSSVRAGSYITLKMEPVKNKKTGAESHARAILPEGFVFKEADLAASSEFRVEGPVSFDYSGRYAALAPFEYAGP